MKILFIAPPPPAPTTGNERSVLRLAAGLDRRGHEVRIVAAQPLAGVRAACEALAPDVVHVYHSALGATGLELDARGGCPVRILTFAGSDLPGRPLAVNHHARIAVEVASADAAMVAFDEQRQAVEAAWPSLCGRVHVIAKGVAAPSGDFPLRSRASFRGDERVALLPAGIRPVKRNLDAITWFGDVVAVEPRARLVLLGDALDADYASTVRRLLATTPYALWLGSVSHAEMGGALRAADVVVNVSAYEGQANALLEAMVLGRPVVASAAPGNHEWLRDGDNALVFHDAAGFVARTARALRREPDVAAISARGAEYVARHHDPEQEIDQLLALYAFAAAGRAKTNSQP